MQVKKRLRINAVVMIVSVIAVLFVLLAAMHRIIRAAEASKIADGIITGSFERVTLRTDYLRTGSERAKEQVFATHKEIGKLLKSAAEEFTDPEDRKTIDALIKDHDSIGKNLRAIVENRKKTGTEGRSAELSREIEDRLLSQLNMRVYETVLLGSKLQDSSEEALMSAFRRAGGGIAFVFLLAGAVTLINSAMMNRTIAGRIDRLRDGALVIGKGDLNHRIDVTGDDEFSDLSAAFNSMTAKLQASYHHLENEIAERERAELDVLKLSEDMAARNVELEAVNRELESFIYSVSHDLRAPLRTISAYAQFLAEDSVDRIDDEGRGCLDRIRKGAAKMSGLIEDLLYLSRISRLDVERQKIEMSKLALSIVSDLREGDPSRSVEINIQDGVVAFADPRLMEIALSNLLGNAWKFTSKTTDARIEFGALEEDGGSIYYVKDNGAGFDTNLAEKIFWPFQRLHSGEEFEGTGIGLTIVERVIHRHGGKIWAEGELGKGATIFFTIQL